MTDCLFCRIVEGDIPSGEVASSDRVLAFRDVTPQAPTHVLVIPKEHYATIGEAAKADAPLVAEMVAMAARVADLAGVTESGYRLVANSGADAGQTVPHAHLHVLGGRALSWPPG